MSDDSNGEWVIAAWKRVPWDCQDYIFFYLRSHHFPITLRNTGLLAQILAKRLAAGPVEHRALEVVIERSGVEYLLDDTD